MSRPLLKDWKEFGELPQPDEALKAGDFTAALSGFAMEHVLELRDTQAIKSDSAPIGIGTALWLLGDFWGAAIVWARVCDEAMRGRYTHSSNGTFQGGLLLWFASAWLKDEDWHIQADGLLEKLLQKKRPVMGVGIVASIARQLRREMELAEVEAKYSAESLFRERQQTLVIFYAGVRAFEEGNREETLRLWSQVREPRNSLVELEYYLLVAERNRLLRS